MINSEDGLLSALARPISPTGLKSGLTKSICDDRIHRERQQSALAEIFRMVSAAHRRGTLWTPDAAFLTLTDVSSVARIFGAHFLWHFIVAQPIGMLAAVTLARGFWRSSMSEAGQK